MHRNCILSFFVLLHMLLLHLLLRLLLHGVFLLGLFLYVSLLLLLLDVLLFHMLMLLYMYFLMAFTKFCVCVAVLFVLAPVNAFACDATFDTAEFIAVFNVSFELAVVCAGGFGFTHCSLCLFFHSLLLRCFCLVCLLCRLRLSRIFLFVLCCHLLLFHSSLLYLLNLRFRFLRFRQGLLHKYKYHL